MTISSTQSLDELEIVLNAAASQLQRLFDENTQLRAELAEMNERMHIAAQKIRAAAERLPQAAVAADTVHTSGAEVAQAKAA